LKSTAKLLHVTESELSTALTKRVIAAGGNVMQKDHNATQAEYGKDALAKAIYDRLFTWIISRINRAILFRGSKTQARFNSVIGVLTSTASRSSTPTALSSSASTTATRSCSSYS